MSRILALATSLMLILMGIFSSPGQALIGEASGTIKAGDWITYDVTTTPIFEGEVFLTWMKFEFISVEGTNATLKATTRLSSGEEKEYGGIIDVVSGSDTGLVIPVNSTIGDSVQISGYENITIQSEEALTYTGVTRTAVKASFSNSTDRYTGSWDKQTGMRLEEQISRYDTSTSKPMTVTTIFKISDTNIWQTRLDTYNPNQNVSYLALILALIAVPMVFLWTRKKKTRRIRKGSTH